MRNKLKKGLAELMAKLAKDIADENSVSDDLKRLVLQLKRQLDNSKGKKVYRYLKPEVKETVDDIFFQLAQNETIKKMYSLWCEMEQAKHDVYSSAKVTFPPLADNQQFNLVKNMIIKTVLEMDRLIIIEGKGHYPSDPATDNANKPVLNNDDPDKIESEENSVVVELNEASVESEGENEQDILQSADTSEQELLASAVLGLLASLSRVIANDYDRQKDYMSRHTDSRLLHSINKLRWQLGEMGHTNIK